MQKQTDVKTEKQISTQELIEENTLLKMKEAWARTDGAMSKFLQGAMKIIEENVTIGKNGKSIVNVELFQKLLDEFTTRDIFMGEVITFMIPYKYIYGEKEDLIVAASTKEKTDEGLKMKGITCGSIAHAAYEKDTLEVTEISDKNRDNKRSRYVGKSYIYPIVDVDQPTGGPIKYGLISIAKLEKKYLPNNYIELLINMGKALGRQLGRVIERKNSEAELMIKNSRLRERTIELKKALDSIKCLHHERGNQLALQTFLFGTINHDFKNELINIKSQTEALLHNRGNKAGIKNVLFSLDGTLDMIRMIDDLEKIDLQVIHSHCFFHQYQKTVEPLIKTICRDKGIQVTWDLVAAERFFFDPRHLHRVMNNLIFNAIKYNREKKEVHVASSIVEEVPLRFFEITISDHGVGIDKNDLEENIFKTRWRSSSAKKDKEVEGTGLGLSYVKYIANKCDAEIKAESRPGRTNRAGIQFVTTFILKIPACTEQQIGEYKKNVSDRKQVLVIAEKGKDNEYMSQGLTYLIDDIRQGLGIKEFDNQQDMKMAITLVPDYPIVVCLGTPEGNKSLINAAKRNNSRVIFLDEKKGKVYIISRESKEDMPVESFLLCAPQLIPLG